MPVLNGHGWQLALLLLALPAQLLLTHFFTSGSTPEDRQVLLKGLLTDIAALPEKMISPALWRQWVESAMASLQQLTGLTGLGSDPVRGESPAEEVLRRTGRNVDLFAFSLDERVPRPREVKFRVGQVVQHKTFRFRGVIVAWDSVAKAPLTWINEHFPQDQQETLMKSPAYRILVDIRDRTEGSRVAYVSQGHLNVLMNRKVINSEINDYFEAFDGAQYLPRPWLRQIYPED